MAISTPSNRLNNSCGHFYKLFVYKLFIYIAEDPVAVINRLMVAVESYNYFDFDFSEETLVTSQRRIFSTSFQPR